MTTYRSSLIKALRNRPQKTMQMSPVSFLPNPVVSASFSAASGPTPARGGIFNPNKLTMQSFAPNVINNRMQFDPLPGVVAGADYGGIGGGDMSEFSGGPMSASQAMNAVAIGRGLSDYGASVVAPGALAAGVIGNAMMGTGQNALSSLDHAMLGISPRGNNGGYESGAGWGDGVEGAGLGW